jgi:hypothetical protein
MTIPTNTGRIGNVVFIWDNMFSSEILQVWFLWKREGMELMDNGCLCWNYSSFLQMRKGTLRQWLVPDNISGLCQSWDTIPFFLVHIQYWFYHTTVSTNWNIKWLLFHHFPIKIDTLPQLQVQTFFLNKPINKCIITSAIILLLIFLFIFWNILKSGY